MKKCYVLQSLLLVYLIQSCHPSEDTQPAISTPENDKLNWVSENKELAQTAARTSEISTPNATPSGDSNSENDSSRSKICETCHCDDNTPFVINCNDLGLKSQFLAADWPHDLLVSSIDASFDSNEFTEVLQLPELPLLKLSYRGNQIEIIQKSAFKYLKSLEQLDLSENRLTHESLNSNVFEGQFNDEDYEPIPLKTLKLGYNQITSIDKDAFNHLSSHLETLELNNNPLKVIDHQTAIAITTLRKLKTLNLAETNLTSIPSGLFNALPSLKILILSGNRFEFIPEELQHAIHLENLNLNNNPIKTLDVKSFEGLSKLKTLNISSMPSLRAIGPNTFTALSSLIHLWCSYNPLLTKINSHAFNNMMESDETFQLTEFHFRGNGLKRIPYKLLPWSTLDVIDIRENPFQCDCNIGSIVSNVIPLIMDKTPEFITEIRCAGPTDYTDRTLDTLAGDLNIVNCSAGDGNNDIDDSWIHDHDDHTGSLHVLTTSSSSGLIVISVFAIFLVIGGMTCFVLMALRKSHLRELYDTSTGQIVHYVRTAGGSGKKDEDEQAIVEKEFGQYSEEP